MGKDEEQITAGEFTRGIDLISRTMTNGFDGVHNRMNRVEDSLAEWRTEHAERLAVLEHNVKTSAGDAAREAVAENVAKKRNTWAGWGAAAGTFAVAAIETIKHLWK